MGSPYLQGLVDHGVAGSAMVFEGVQRMHRRIFTIGAMALAALGLAAPAHAATISVTTTADTIAIDGLASLREAITSINNQADVNGDVTLNRVGGYATAPGGSADLIAFNITGAGVKTIAVTSAEPILTKPMAINGQTQPTATGTPKVGIVLDGSGAGAVPGLEAQAPVNIMGLVIVNFSDAANGAGVRLDTPSSQRSFVQFNVIGADATGTTAQPNAIGIKVASNSNVIVNNVVSGNAGAGIQITGSGNSVGANMVGTNAAGTAAVPNGGPGVSLGASGNVLGGGPASVRNVISGNSGDGVAATGAFSNAIVGNYIGTDVSGANALPNAGNGVALAGGGATVAGGSTTAPQRIWFNRGFGINDTASGDFFRRNSIKGNAAGGISVAGPTPTGSVSLSPDNRTITVNFSNAVPGQVVNAEAYDNPGAPGCPGQGETFVAGATVASSTGTGTLTLTLNTPLTPGDGLTATVSDDQNGTSPFICLAGGVRAPAGPAPLPVGPIAPVLSGLALHPASFRAARSGPTATAAKTATGTVISYSDSEPSRTTFTVLQPRSGVREGKRCVTAPRGKPKGKKRKGCQRLVALGSFAHADRPGRNRLRFTGRIRGRKLRPGPYQLRAQAKSSAGKTSRPLTQRFRIKR
jgi:parallel beta-helix repeat protein